MVDKNELKKFTIPRLKAMSELIKNAQSKDELFCAIAGAIEEKQIEKEKSSNSKFLVEWMNIDPRYREILHHNGITTEADLLEVEDLRSLQEMTEGAYEQISWARNFFNMQLFDALEPQDRTKEQLVKTLVKSINGLDSINSTGNMIRPQYKSLQNKVE